jgi:hypothetical protein
MGSAYRLYGSHNACATIENNNPSSDEPLMLIGQNKLSRA